MLFLNFGHKYEKYRVLKGFLTSQNVILSTIALQTVRLSKNCNEYDLPKKRQKRNTLVNILLIQKLNHT